MALKNESSVLKHEIKNCETSIEDQNDNKFSSDADDKEDDDLEEHEYQIEGQSPKLKNKITLNSFFKTKGFNLLQIKPNSNPIEKKIGECPVNFLSKCVATSDEECYLIGGASDIKQSKVYPFLFKANS